MKRTFSVAYESSQRETDEDFVKYVLHTYQVHRELIYPCSNFMHKAIHPTDYTLFQPFFQLTIQKFTRFYNLVCNTPNEEHANTMAIQIFILTIIICSNMVFPKCKHSILNVKTNIIERVRLVLMPIIRLIIKSQDVNQSVEPPLKLVKKWFDKYHPEYLQ